MFELAILVSLAVTVSLLGLQLIPSMHTPFLLVIRAERKFAENTLLSIVKNYSTKLRIASKNVTARDVNMIIEVQAKEISQLIDEVATVEGVSSVTFMYHEGEVKS